MIAEIANASGRDITYVAVSVDEFAAGAAEHGAPAELVESLTYLFSDVLGKLAYPTNTVNGSSAVRRETSPTSPPAPPPPASGPPANR